MDTSADEPGDQPKLRSAADALESLRLRSSRADAVCARNADASAPPAAPSSDPNQSEERLPELTTAEECVVLDSLEERTLEALKRKWLDDGAHELPLSAAAERRADSLSRGGASIARDEHYKAARTDDGEAACAAALSCVADWGAAALQLRPQQIEPTTRPLQSKPAEPTQYTASLFWRRPIPAAPELDEAVRPHAESRVDAQRARPAPPAMREAAPLAPTFEPVRPTPPIGSEATPSSPAEPARSTPSTESEAAPQSLAEPSRSAPSPPTEEYHAHLFWRRPLPPTGALETPQPPSATPSPSPPVEMRSSEGAALAKERVPSNAASLAAADATSTSAAAAQESAGASELSSSTEALRAQLEEVEAALRLATADVQCQLLQASQVVELAIDVVGERSGRVSAGDDASSSEPDVSARADDAIRAVVSRHLSDRLG